MPCFFNTYRLEDIQVTWFPNDESQGHKAGKLRVLTDWETRSDLKYCQIGVALDLQWMSFRFIQLEHLALQWNVRLEIKENPTGMWDGLVQLHFQTHIIVETLFLFSQIIKNFSTCKCWSNTILTVDLTIGWFAYIIIRQYLW